MNLKYYDVPFDTQTECGIESIDVYENGFKAFDIAGNEIKEFNEVDLEQVWRFIRDLDLKPRNLLD